MPVRALSGLSCLSRLILPNPTAPRGSARTMRRVPSQSECTGAQVFPLCASSIRRHSSAGRNGSNRTFVLQEKVSIDLDQHALRIGPVDCVRPYRTAGAGPLRCRHKESLGFMGRLARGSFVLGRRFPQDDRIPFGHERLSAAVEAMASKFFPHEPPALTILQPSGALYAGWCSNTVEREVG